MVSYYMYECNILVQYQHQDPGIMFWCSAHWSMVVVFIPFMYVSENVLMYFSLKEFVYVSAACVFTFHHPMDGLQGVLHGPPHSVLGKDGGTVLRHLQLLHRKGLRQVTLRRGFAFYQSSPLQ